MRGHLRQFLRRHPEVDMHFVGQDYRELFNLPNTRWTSWNANLVDYLHNLDFDIGVAPLAYNVFNRSKSDIKVLEYASLGIPAVASDVRPVRRQHRARRDRLPGQARPRVGQVPTAARRGSTSCARR